jgi:hypothetical protein
MRFSVAACLTALAAPIAAASIANGQSPNLAKRGDDDHKVPGDSPLEFCPGDHSDDLVEINKVDLSPNPPKPGQELLITASGVVKEKIEEGAYVLLTVKYGLIRLISTKASLCEQVENVDLKCPLEPGKVEVTKSVDIPAEIPPGKYTVLADVYTEDEVPITCLTATVSFSRGKSVLGLEL